MLINCIKTINIEFIKVRSIIINRIRFAFSCLTAGFNNLSY